MNPIHDPLIQKINQTLDEQSEQIDAASRSRLNRMRQIALNANNHNKNDWFVNGASFASIITISIAIGLMTQTKTAELSTKSAVTVNSELSQSELLTAAANGDLELASELEFYLWLEQELEKS